MGLADPIAASALEGLHGVLLTVAYDGARFHGWAAQPGGVRTVEETLRGALREMAPEASPPRGTSRTDAGVHARAQMVAFDTSRPIPPRGWVLGLNQNLPDDVAVRGARAVPPGFAPRFACRHKLYEYVVSTDPVRCPLTDARAWRVGPGVDVERMACAARHLVGTHDFAAFRTARDERTSTTRTLLEVTVAREGPSRVRFSFRGTAFLYNMVRILVGTLVDIGKGRLDEGCIPRAFVEKDRSALGPTAPPQGLLLALVDLDMPPGTGEPWPPS